MDIETNGADLAKAVARVQGAISEKSLGHIGLKAENAKLCLAVNDQNLAVFSEYPGLVNQEGEAFVPARLFSDLIRELPSGVVRLKSDGVNLIISTAAEGGFRAKIALKSHINWQRPPSSADFPARVSLDALSLAYMIEQVQFCVASESPRPYASVAYLHRQGKSGLRLVGTDGFRLSYCDVEVELSEGFLAEGICLTKRVLNEIYRMCGEGIESVHLALNADEGALLVEIDGYQIFAGLSAVKYPNYRGVLPQAKVAEVDIARPVLHSVARRILLAAGKTKAIRMKFGSPYLTLWSQDIEASEGLEKIELKNYNGPEREITLNGRYLSDVFANVASDELQMSFNDDEDPILLVPKSEPRGLFSQHVLVPIKQSD